MGALADAIRRKYPGSYQEMDDITLEAAVVKKYPVYARHASPEALAKMGGAAAPDIQSFSELYGAGGERNQAGTDEEVRSYPTLTTYGPPVGSNALVGPGATGESIRHAKVVTGAALSSIPGPAAVELPLQFAGGALMASAEGEDPLKGGATDVALNLLLRGVGKGVGKVLDARAARKVAEAARQAEEAAAAGVPEVLPQVGEAAVHEAGRPATRRRLLEALQEAGYHEGDLKGRSANELKQLLREQGVDPKMAGRSVGAVEDVGAGETLAPPPARPDEFVDRSVMPLEDDTADLEAIVAGEKAGRSAPKPARGGMSRELQEIVDDYEARAERGFEPAPREERGMGAADDTLFDERFDTEASRDLPTAGIDEPQVREVAGERVESRPRDAWHPQHGQVRVDVVKGDRVLGTDLRGRPRVMDKRDLKFLGPEDLRPAPDAPPEFAPAIEARDPDLEDVLRDMGIEPGTPKVRPGPGMGMGQAEAPRGSAQHRAFKRGKAPGAEGAAPSPRVHASARRTPRPAPPPAEPPPPPGPGAPEFDRGLKEKVRAAIKAQRAGRGTADERNIRLHAKQARVMRKWADAAQAGEVSHGQAQLQAMMEMHRVGAGIEEVAPARFSAEELKALHGYNLSQGWGDTFEKFRMANSLEGLQAGRQLQANELKAMRKLLGPAFVPHGARDWTLWQWMKYLPQIASGTMKSLRASFDISAPLRQAKQLTIGHPAEAAQAFGAQLQALVSEGKYKSLLQVIEDNPLRELQRASGLHLSDLSDVQAIAAAGGDQAEEVFSHSAGQLIPGIGRAVRGSERAYVTYLNKMRSDIFNKMAYSYMNSGILPETDPRVFKKLAEAVNLMSGRGELGKVGERAMPLLQTLFFAPRFMASRFMLLRDLPRLYMNYPAPVRKLLLKNVMLDIAATSAALYGAAQLTGATVETDPRSSDVGKLKIGDVRLDPWAGFQPWVRLLAQLGSAERKSPLTGEVKELKGFGGDRVDAIYKFLEQKAAPGPAIARDVLRGTDPVGNPNDFFREEFPYVGKSTIDQITPFIINDLVEVMQRADDELLLLTVPFSAVGGGVQAFGARDQKKKQGPSGPF